MKRKFWQDDDLEGAAAIALDAAVAARCTPDTRRAYYGAEVKRWPIFKMRNGRGSSRLQASKSSLRRCRESRIKRAEREALGDGASA